MRSLCPRGARPYRRAILVEAQVSSIKTRRSGSRSSCPSNQSSRRFTTSGRSCSLACAAFFARDLVTIKETPERSVAHDDVRFWRRACRSSSIVMSGGSSTANRLPAHGFLSCANDGRRPPPWRRVPCVRSNARHRLTLAALTPKRRPPSSRCSIGHGRKHTGAKIHRQGFVPPASNPAGSLNHSIANSGIPIPIQSVRIAP